MLRLINEEVKMKKEKKFEFIFFVGNANPHKRLLKNFAFFVAFIIFFIIIIMWIIANKKDKRIIDPQFREIYLKFLFMRFILPSQPKKWIKKSF